MDTVAPIRLATYFGMLRDPRVRGRCEHRLLDIIVMALCAVIANCNDWQQIAVFAQERQDWFARFLALPNGVPSHDTFERVFDRLDPAAFQKCFRAWVRALTRSLDLPHIAIDGKTLRSSGSDGADLGPLHLVSAWATEAHLSLGQVAVDEKSNEITAIPQLLALLDLKGALVSIDAMGCQKEIAAQIVQGGGGYLLTVKGNQGHLLEDIQQCVEKALDTEERPAFELHTTTEKGHGREETRLYTVIHNPAGIRDQEAWPKLHTIGMCASERTVAGKTSSETRYFISNEPLSAAAFAVATRDHWGIENTLHWQLDVTFREDENRVSRRHGAENLALLRRLALSLLKQEGSKQSLACKRLRAALSTRFLEKVLHAADNLGEV
jgi:predicted transposase YbfD/YdcC